MNKRRPKKRKKPPADRKKRMSLPDHHKVMAVVEPASHSVYADGLGKPFRVTLTWDDGTSISGSIRIQPQAPGLQTCSYTPGPLGRLANRLHPRDFIWLTTRLQQLAEPDKDRTTPTQAHMPLGCPPPER